VTASGERGGVEKIISRQTGSQRDNGSNEKAILTETGTSRMRQTSGNSCTNVIQERPGGTKNHLHKKCFPVIRDFPINRSRLRCEKFRQRSVELRAVSPERHDIVKGTLTIKSHLQRRNCSLGLPRRRKENHEINVK